MAGIGMNWFEWLEIAGNIWKWLEMTNHHDKQLTPSESWDQDGFFEPGFGVSSYSNHWARLFTTLWPPNQGEHLDRLIYTKQTSGKSRRN